MATRTFQIPLLTGRTPEGDPIIGGGDGAPGTFTAYLDPWDDGYCTLVAQWASGNTQTSTLVLPFVLPQDYVAGSNAQLGVNALALLVDGALGTHTLAAKVWRMLPGQGLDAPYGVNLVTTSTQVLATSWDNYAFTLDGQDLVPGDRLLVVLRTVIQETQNGQARAGIGKVGVTVECEDLMDAGNVAGINVDSTGGQLPLAKALEVIVARCVGDLAYDSETGVVTFKGRDAETPVATVKLTGGGARQDSTIP